MRETRRLWAYGAIAMIDPVGDAGIGGFTHELANGLAAYGARVDVYTTRQPFAGGIPGRCYRLIPLFGDTSRSLADRVRNPFAASVAAPAAIRAARCALSPYFDLLDRRAKDPVCLTGPAAPSQTAPGHAHLAHSEDPVELARLLSERAYGLVWTQWPDLGDGTARFWNACRHHDIPLVHTVHNVVPHERDPGNTSELQSVYGAVDVLVVHSRAAARSLSAMAPGCADRIVVSQHGLYSTYPRRPAARSPVRARLGLTERSRALLFFGGVRPYKNLDALLDALAECDDPHLQLVVAGWEWGYGRHADPLARTRAAVRARGLGRRVHLLPGPFGRPQTAELFEAADAVVLPYLEGSGSGVLLMAMTFGTHVIVSPAGGMHEYLAHYRNHTKLAGPDVRAIRDGLDRFLRWRAPDESAASEVEHLTWSAIAGRLLPEIAARLEFAAVPANA